MPSEVSASIPKVGKTRQNDVLAHERTFPRASVYVSLPRVRTPDTSRFPCACATSVSPDIGRSGPVSGLLGKPVIFLTVCFYYLKK